MGVLYEPILHIYGGLISYGLLAQVSSVWLQSPGAAVILKDFFQYLVPDIADVTFILDRKDGLHPVVQIPCHQIGAAEKNLFIPIIIKIENPAMFQETPDHTDHANVFTEIWHSRHQAAYSADR